MQALSPLLSRCAPAPRETLKSHKIFGSRKNKPHSKPSSDPAFWNLSLRLHTFIAFHKIFDNILRFVIFSRHSYFSDGLNETHRIGSIPSHPVDPVHPVKILQLRLCRVAQSFESGIKLKREVASPPVSR